MAVIDSRPAVHSPTVVRRIYPDDLPGWWGKTLEVRAGQQAVLVRKGVQRVLRPARHRVRGFLGTDPDDLALVEAPGFTLHPAVGGLLSGDDKLVSADFLVKVQVADPAGLSQSLGSERERLSLGDLAGLAASEVRPTLAAAARRYTASDLCGSPTVAQEVGGELRGFLAYRLESLGLKVERVSHVTFLQAEDAVRREDALRDLRARLRGGEMRARLAAVRDERQFWDAMAQLEQEYRLRDLLREEELVELKANLLGAPPEEGDGARANPAPPAAPAKAEAPPAEAAPAVATPPAPPELPAGAQAAPPAEAPADGRDLAALLDQRLAAYEEQLAARFDQLLKKLGHREPAEEGEAPLKAPRGLKRWATALQALGAAVLFGTTLVTLLVPDFRPPDLRWAQFLTASSGLVLAVLAFGSALWVGNRIRTQRHDRYLQYEAARLSVERRQAEERMVRARVEGALKQAEAGLEEAWTRAYRGNQQPLANSLRLLAKRIEPLRDELQATGYQASALLTRKEVRPADLQPLLELDEALLQQATDLAETTLTLRPRVAEGRLVEVETAARKLEDGLQELNNRLIRRGALLKGVGRDQLL